VLQGFTDADGVTLPPKVERASWADPDDLDPGNMASARTRRARLIDGYRRRNTLLNLHVRNPREITKRHVEAAGRLTRDFEVGHEGARSAGGRNGVGGAEPGWPTHQQLAALRRYREARDALGATLWGIVHAIVLVNLTMDNLATLLRLSPDRTHGRFAAAMDRLADHYALGEVE